MKQKTKRLITWGLVIMMIVPMLASIFMSITASGLELTYKGEDNKTYTVNDFRDTQGHWAQGVCKLWAEHGIINGVGNANFAPNDYIKRCDLACILDRMMGLDLFAYNGFADLEAKTYYTDSMLKANAYGYIQGDGYYIMPHDVATREQVATILYRAFELQEKNVRGTARFSDMSQVSSWAQEPVNVMATLGYIKGHNNMFRPNDPITRAEFVQMIHNITGAYITSVSGRGNSESYSNMWQNNLSMCKKNVTLLRSEIEGDIYCLHGNKSLTMDNTTVDGTLYIFGDMVKVTLSNTEVDRIEVFGQANVTGAENVSEIVIHENASGTSLDAVVDYMVLAGNTLVNIENGYYHNDSNRVKDYDGEEIYEAIADAGVVLKNAPEVKCSKISISSINEVKVTSLRPKNSGAGVLKTFGLLAMEGTDTPNINDYDDKISFRASYLDSVYEDDPTQDRGSLTEVVTTQSDNETWTYVPFAMNTNGLISYGDPVTLRAYDWDYDVKVIDTGDYPESVRFEVWVAGDNIPKIDELRCYYSSSLDYNEVKTYKSMTLDKNLSITSGQDIKYRYIVDIEASKNESGVKAPAKNFGVEFDFRDETKVYNYPILTNAEPSEVSPVTKITTGNATQKSETSFNVTGNMLRAYYEEVLDYGVIYTTDESQNTDYWERAKVGSYVTPNSSKSYDAVILAPNTEDYKLYYRAYVRTDHGYYYGDIKVINSRDLGDVGAPVLERQGFSFEGLNDTSVMLRFQVSQTDALIFTEFKDSFGNSIVTYAGQQITNSNDNYFLQSGYGTDTLGTGTSTDIHIPVTGLTNGETYTVKYRLMRKDKVSDIKEVTFTAGTDTLVSITGVSRELGSGQITFAVSGIAKSISLKNVSNLTNQSATQINKNDNTFTTTFSEGKNILAVEYSYVLPYDAKYYTFTAIIEVN